MTDREKRAQHYRDRGFTALAESLLRPNDPAQHEAPVARLKRVWSRPSYVDYSRERRVLKP